MIHTNTVVINSDNVIESDNGIRNIINNESADNRPDIVSNIPGNRRSNKYFNIISITLCRRLFNPVIIVQIQSIIIVIIIYLVVLILVFGDDS